MQSNHIINAMHFIAAHEYDKAISLWRMYMRFRHHCTTHCIGLGLEPSTEMCGHCLCDNLRTTAEDQNEDLGRHRNAYVKCSGELDAWLDKQRKPAA
ncbi:hypothetical protein V5T82_07015 [Magnetovibrio sp. PR-2]|uniref:hypothetical protein n=1 Tax=Magnetovibrio sp. PR-2 TaxID=3120356 RepID=UPI002FCE415D